MKALFLLLSLPVYGEFHIGIYNLRSPENLATVAAAGFTHVLSDDAAIADAAVLHGLRVVGIPRPTGPSRPSESPEVAAWYIADEPEVNRQTSDDISTIAAAVRRWDPGTPLTLVVGDARFAATYAPWVDVLMVDWYPVPHLPLGSLGDQVSMAVSHSGGKPVWAVIQAMDWKDYPQRDPQKPRIGRFPTLDEMRFMSYHAVLRGASGVYFFEFQRRSVPGASLLNYPDRWHSLKTVAQELSAVREFLSASPGKKLPLARLEGREWASKGRRLTVLVNPTPGPSEIPEGLLAGTWRTLFSGSADFSPASGTTLAPWQAVVLTQP